MNVYVPGLIDHSRDRRTTRQHQRQIARHQQGPVGQRSLARLDPPQVVRAARRGGREVPPHRVAHRRGHRGGIPRGRQRVHVTRRRRTAGARAGLGRVGRRQRHVHRTGVGPARARRSRVERARGDRRGLLARLAAADREVDRLGRLHVARHVGRAVLDLVRTVAGDRDRPLDRARVQRLHADVAVVDDVRRAVVLQADEAPQELAVGGRRVARARGLLARGVLEHLQHLTVAGDRVRLADDLDLVVDPRPARLDLRLSGVQRREVVHGARLLRLGRLVVVDLDLVTAVDRDPRRIALTRADLARVAVRRRASRGLDRVREAHEDATVAARARARVPPLQLDHEVAVVLDRVPRHAEARERAGVPAARVVDPVQAAGAGLRPLGHVGRRVEDRLLLRVRLPLAAVDPDLGLGDAGDRAVRGVEVNRDGTVVVGLRRLHR